MKLGRYITAKLKVWLLLMVLPMEILRFFLASEMNFSLP